MWSHYADKHHGICIEFEIDAFKLLRDGYLTFVVDYETEFTPIPYFVKQKETRAEVFTKYLSTKANFWDYEKEVRIVDFDYFRRHTTEYVNFENYADINKVYLGIKTKQDDKSKLKKMLKKNSHIDMIQLKACTNKFELMI